MDNGSKNIIRGSAFTRSREDGQSAIRCGRSDVRLSGDLLRGLLGGQKYVKTEGLAREVLLEYAKKYRGL
jgi:hypothetical protein